MKKKEKWDVSKSCSVTMRHIRTFKKLIKYYELLMPINLKTEKVDEFELTGTESRRNSW